MIRMASNTNAFVVSFLVAVVAIAYAILKTTSFFEPTPIVPQIEPVEHPKYYIPTRDRSKLIHVEEAFERAGYRLVTNENVSADWHTMWTFHNPFWNREPSVDLPAMMLKLKPHQMVNHIPGASYFTNKVDLARHSRGFDFVPESFLLPKQYEAFQKYRKDHPSLVWVRKSSKHRGVKIIDPEDPTLSNTTEKESVVQRFIVPHLIDNRLFDVGVYVAITSVQPLKLYTFDNVLIRACADLFEKDLEKAPRSAYVVADDYMPPWGLTSFRPYYSWGMSTLNVLRAYFFSKGVSFDDIFWQMKADILQLIGNAADHLEEASTKYPFGQKHFYSMYRFDFLIDENLKPWITEVNQSPNLSSHYLKDLGTMFQRIAYSLLSLVGLTPGGMHHPESNEKDLEILFHANDIDIAYSICAECGEDCSVSTKCSLCRRCRTPQQSAMLKELISEQRSRLGFIPLYPLRNSTFESMKHLRLRGEDNELLQDFVLMKCEQDYTWC